MFQFDNKGNMNEVLQGGPYYIYGNPLLFEDNNDLSSFVLETKRL